MLKSGLRATVNSDDPAYVGGYVNDNFRALAATGRLDRDDFIILAHNSFLGSFLPDEAVAGHLARCDAYVREFACTMSSKAFPPIARRRFSPIFRSEEHTSELKSLMRTSYAVFCLQKKQ